ncbi:MAG: hypothetical protein LLG06_07180 [Desulfobacteraceae bacterium]|nr:hypothetical protein [Desulfobacteraceae bacterium]
MVDGKERPRAGDPPQLNSPLEILRELLQTERDRLQVALRIEKERSIVFPETTVIVRDIERLTLEIEKRELIHESSKTKVLKQSSGLDALKSMVKK